MSKKVTYRCDLCRDDLPLSELDGLQWVGDGERWKIVPASQVDYPHICHRCEDRLHVAIGNRSPEGP